VHSRKADLQSDSAGKPLKSGQARVTGSALEVGDGRLRGPHELRHLTLGKTTTSARLNEGPHEAGHRLCVLEAVLNVDVVRIETQFGEQIRADSSHLVSLLLDTVVAALPQTPSLGGPAHCIGHDRYRATPYPSAG
jgi:hypothetical protein